MHWFRGIGIVAGLGIGALVGCTDRESPGGRVAREFAAHLCPVADACPCEQVLHDCEQTVLDRVGVWERRALDLGLVLDEECLDGALETLDAFAECGTNWFGECYVYTGGANVGEPCEQVDDIGIMSPCAQGLFCRNGACAEESRPILDVGEQCATEDSSIVPVGPNGGVCREPLRCDWMASNVCVETSPTGATCTRETNCWFGDFCRGSSPDVMPSDDDPGVCAPRTKQQGEACEYLYECLDTICVDGICLELMEPPPRPSLCDMIFAVDYLQDDAAG